MKQALLQVESINQLLDQAKNSKSSTVKRDFKKGAKRKIRELREYCFYRGLNFKEISSGIKKECSHGK